MIYSPTMINVLLNLVALLACVYGMVEFREAYPERTLLWGIPIVLAVWFGLSFLVSLMEAFDLDFPINPFGKD